MLQAASSQPDHVTQLPRAKPMYAVVYVTLSLSDLAAFAKNQIGNERNVMGACFSAIRESYARFYHEAEWS
jgi:hypothetical protein